MITKGYVDTRWGQVHYRRAGMEGPAILLFHESPLSAAVYDDAMEAIAPSARAVAFDTPGYGESAGPPAETEIPEYAATLLEAIDGLRLDRFAVAGAHTGASLALQVALQAGPERCGHVVFSGVPVLTAEEREQYLATWAPHVDPVADGAHFRWAWERYVRIWKEPAEAVNVGATILLSNLRRYHWAYNAAFRYDPEPDLPRLEVPTLFLTAENDLLIESDRRALGVVQDSRLEVVPGLPGQLPLRRPDLFASAVTRFVTGSD